jgi:class 3 adenylate cyclase
LSKNLDAGEGNADRDCTVFFSAATGASVANLPEARSLGRHRLRGRLEEVEVFRLIPGDT